MDTPMPWSLTSDPKTDFNSEPPLLLSGVTPRLNTFSFSRPILGPAIFLYCNCARQLFDTHHCFCKNLHWSFGSDSLRHQNWRSEKGHQGLAICPTFRRSRDGWAMVFDYRGGETYFIRFGWPLDINRPVLRGSDSGACV